MSIDDLINKQLIMDRKQILLKIQDVFRSELDAKDLQIEEETTIFDIEEWDSLSHIVICGALEKLFNVKFTAREMLSCESISSLIDAISKKI